MSCDGSHQEKPLLYPPGAEIRHQFAIDDGLIVAGERFHPIGAIQPPDGRFGGHLLVRSPNCWMEWRITTVWNHVEIPTYVRTGPASWSAFRLTSGCQIEYRCPATSRFIVEQNTGILTSTPVSESDVQGAFWFEPDWKARTPTEVLPLAGDVVPPADFEPLAPGTRSVIGYAPRMTRFVFVGCPQRLNVQAVYQGSPNILASKLVNGPNNGDDSFYIGQWAALQLENLDPENAAPFKLVWSEEPGGNQ